MILLGILAVIVGILAIAWPGVTILALVVVVAAWALVGGVAEFFTGQLRHLDSDVRSLPELRHAA